MIGDVEKAFNQLTIARDRRLQAAENELEGFGKHGIPFPPIYSDSPDGPVRITDEDDYVVTYAIIRERS